MSHFCRIGAGVSWCYMSCHVLVCMYAWSCVDMYVCMVVCWYVCMYGHVLICMYAWSYVGVYVCMVMYWYVCMHGHVLVCMYVWSCVGVYVCMVMCWYVCMYGHVLVCMYAWSCVGMYVCMVMCHAYMFHGCLAYMHSDLYTRIHYISHTHNIPTSMRAYIHTWKQLELHNAWIWSFSLLESGDTTHRLRLYAPTWLPMYMYRHWLC
jgi:hypothetical protein